MGIDGEIRIGALFDILQDTASLQIDSVEAIQTYFRDYNCGFFLANWQIDIERRPRYGELVTVGTVPFYCNSGYGKRCTFIYDSENNPLVRSVCTAMFVNRVAAKPMRVPSEIVSLLNLGPQLEMEILPRKIEVGNTEKIGTVIPSKIHIDSNRHVNNARYIDLVEDFLPEDFSYDRVRTEYKKALRPHEQADVGLSQSEKTVTLTLSVDKQMYFTAEFWARRAL